MKKILIIVLFFTTFSLTSCWDSRELTKIYIVSGLSIDSVPNSEDIDLSVQVLRQTSTDSPKKEGSQNQTMVFQSQGSTISECIKKINRDIDKELYLPHNQVVLFGEEIAKRGLVNYVDYFFRNLKSRIEVALFIVDGKAADFLVKELDGVSMSGIYLNQMVNSFYKLSPYYKVRLVDFVERLLDKTSSPVIPYICIKQTEEKHIIEVCGMAVFKADKMVFHLVPQQVENYVLTMGDVSGGYVQGEKNEDGQVIFNIISHKLKKKVNYENGQLQISLNYFTELSINEIVGYKKYASSEILDILKEEAKKTIHNNIMELYKINCLNETDIYEYGLTLYRFDYKSWKMIINSWDKTYSDSNISIKIDLKIKDIGKIIETVEVD